MGQDQNFEIKRPYYRLLDSIRGIAAIAVVLNHVYGIATGRLGSIAVSIFFTLSGFLVTRLLTQGSYPTLWTFYMRRLARLLPSQLLTLLVAGLVSWYTSHDKPERVFSLSWQAGLYFGNIFLDDHQGTYVAHYWSLALEEQFYLVWPICLIAILQLQRFQQIIFFAMLIFPSAILRQSYFYQGFELYAMKSIITNIFAIFAGAAQAIVYPIQDIAMENDEESQMSLARTPNLVTKHYYFMIDIGLLGIASAYFFSLRFYLWSTLADLAATPCTMLMIHAIVRLHHLQGKKLSQHWLLSNHILQEIGGCSYAWYLFHLPFLSLCNLRDAANGTAFCAAMAVLIASFYYTHYVEKPLQRVLRQVIS